VASSSRRCESLPALFDKALKIGGNTHTREDIAEGIKLGRFQYWGDDECCVVTEIVAYPRCQKLHLFIAAGNLQRLFDVYLPKVKAFAREHGCVSLTSVSRKGFLKRFPAVGFKPKCVTFELDLKDGENV
jgi:hypothetical protein